MRRHDWRWPLTNLNLCRLPGAGFVPQQPFQGAGGPPSHGAAPPPRPLFPVGGAYPPPQGAPGQQAFQRNTITAIHMISRSRHARALQNSEIRHPNTLPAGFASRSRRDASRSLRHASRRPARHEQRRRCRVAGQQQRAQGPGARLRRRKRVHGTHHSIHAVRLPNRGIDRQTRMTADSRGRNV